MVKHVITQIGPYPPPYGGVSVHIQRLCHKLRAIGVASDVYCQPEHPGSPALGVHPRPRYPRLLRRVGWMLDTPRRINADIVHFHELGVRTPWAMGLLARGQRVLITVHNQESLLSRRWWPLSNLCPTLSTMMITRDRRTRWIAVSERIRAQLIQCGVDPSMIAVIPAYLPPPRDGNAVLPGAISEFASVHRPLLSVYGTNFVLDARGIDLYGFDMCLDAVARMKPHFSRMGLVLCVPCCGRNSAYRRDLEARASRLNIRENIMFQTEPMPDASPLWDISDVYLRPSTTDGDAIAVREALALGVPVVASDASPRPGDVLLFPSRNLDVFVASIREALVLGRVRKTWPEHDVGFNAVCDVYSKVLAGLPLSSPSGEAVL